MVEGNETALKLYQRFGFEVFGRYIWAYCYEAENGNR